MKKYNQGHMTKAFKLILCIGLAPFLFLMYLAALIVSAVAILFEYESEFKW